MYKISQMADFFGVTVKTLYVYEEHGLLLPAWTDPHTGYRWYDNNSILRMSLILQLKDSGMTLKEIRAYLSGELALQKQLEKLYELRSSIERSIALLSSWTIPEDMHRVEWGRFEARCCLSRTLVSRDAEEIFAVHDLLLTEAVQRGIAIDRRYCSFCRFHGGELRMTDIPVTVYLNIQADSAPEDAVRLPENAVILTRHKGVYENIGAAYDALWAYVSSLGLTVTGDPIESYIESYGSGDPNGFITEVMLPVENKRKERVS
ncbi:MAG TPA: MerR family transcriptional regulator [Syntrophomonas sp.]|nr:MerR family transcriptional regulator [Syntrophomonas sp.]